MNGVVSPAGQEKGPGVPAPGPTSLRSQTHQEDGHSSVGIAPRGENALCTEKQIATLRARAALAGVVLHALEDDHGVLLFVATKWALTRQMGSVDEVEEFLQRIGAPA